MGEGRFAATNCSVTRRRIIIPISHINNLFNPLNFFGGAGGEERQGKEGLGSGTPEVMGSLRKRGK